MNSTGFASVTTCFFPIRYFPYRGEKLKDDAPYATESEQLKSILRGLASSVERKGGCLDINQLSFRLCTHLVQRMCAQQFLFSSLR
jgi:hypothetical protein